ncbi:TMV resistance protein N, partial [Trifolium medium]|nr:TMV resistance protein N [Trifolium medium]
LKELEHIMDCCRYYGQVVVPIFYHVDPSDVRNDMGAYRKAMQETAKRRSSGEERMRIVLSKWATALTEVGNLSGWVFNDVR